MALIDKLTAIANAIRSKTGGSSSLTLTQMATEIANISTGSTPTGTININSNGTYDVSGKASAVVAVPLPNAYVTTSTIDTHKSTDVSLCTLPDTVIAHKDDTNFTISMVNTTPELLATYDDFNILAYNNAGSPKAGSYPVYGCGNRKNGATAVGTNSIYYPPNSTNNTNSLGGLGKFYISNKVLYYKSYQYFLGAGTWNITVSW